MKEEVTRKSEEKKKEYGEKSALHFFGREHEQRNEEDCRSNENMRMTVTDEEKAHNKDDVEEDRNPG